MHYFYFVSLFFYYLLFSFTLFTLENVVAIIDCKIFERISPHFFVCIILLVYIFAIQKKIKSKDNGYLQTLFITQSLTVLSSLARIQTEQKQSKTNKLYEWGCKEERTITLR